MEESPFDISIEDKHRLAIVTLQQIIKLGTFTAGQWHADNFLVTNAKPVSRALIVFQINMHSKTHVPGTHSFLSLILKKPLLLKSSQNKKGQKFFFQVHSFWCLFLQLAVEKKTPKTVHLEIFSALLILKRLYINKRCLI